MTTRIDAMPAGAPLASSGADLLPEHPAGDATVKWIALAVALALHFTALLLPLPDLGSGPASPGPLRVSLTVRKYVPPAPPPPVARRTARKEFTRKIPVPDPTPDALEPITEAAPEIVPEVPGDGPGLLLLGSPRPPGASGVAGGGRVEGDGPFVAGVGRITVPERIEDSYVQPAYPELARTARLEGRVILQAVIRKDGSVGEVRLLHCTQTHVGFEQAAEDAVLQWRYRPSTLDGRPVAVYFTVVVEFDLL